MNPEKYLQMKMMFIQQDHQWPARNESLRGYISKENYKDLAGMQIHERLHPIIMRRCTLVVTKTF